MILAEAFADLEQTNKQITLKYTYTRQKLIKYSLIKWLVMA